MANAKLCRQKNSKREIHQQFGASLFCTKQRVERPLINYRKQKIAAQLSHCVRNYSPCAVLVFLFYSNLQNAMM